MVKFREIRLSQKTIDEVTSALKNGELVVGPFVEKVERKMEEITGVPHCVAVSSGTMALKIAMDLNYVGTSGHKVLVPDLSFIATASSVLESGGELRYCDVDLDSFVMTKELVDKEIEKDPAIEAIVPVHLGGNIVEGLDFLPFPLVYDSAHYVGPAKDMTSFSFYPTKMISGVDGGCICLKSEKNVRRAKELRNFGFEEGTRILGDDDGYKGNMTNISAVVIYNNLLVYEEVMNSRRAILGVYNSLFKLDNKGIGMYMVKVKDPDIVVKKLQGQAIRHYPLSLSEMIEGEAMNPIAKFLAEHLVSLPFHEHMTEDDAFSIYKEVKDELI